MSLTAINESVVKEGGITEAVVDFREIRRDDSLAATVGRRKGIFAGTFVTVLIGGLVATFVAKPVYEATTTVVFPLKSNSVLSPMQMAVGGALATMNAATPLRQGQFLLESPAATAKVAAALGQTRTETEKARRIDNNPSANAIIVRATDEDPARAQKICHLYMLALRDLTASTGDSGQVGDMKALDRRISEVEADGRQAQKELANFQKGLISAPAFVTTGSSVIVVPGPWLEETRRAELDLRQIDARIAARKGNVATAAKTAATDPTNIPNVRPLRDQLVQLDLEYRTAKTLGGPKSADVLRLQGQIEETHVTLKHELNAYLRAFNSNVADSDIIGLLTDRVAADARLRSVAKIAASAPGEAARYQTLIEKVGTTTDALEKLRAQQMNAEMQDDADPNRWSVLDDATLAEKPVNKSFLMATMLYAPLGLIIATCVACFTDRRKLPL